MKYCVVSGDHINDPQESAVEVYFVLLHTRFTLSRTVRYLSKTVYEMKHSVSRRLGRVPWWYSRWCWRELHIQKSFRILLECQATCITWLHVLDLGQLFSI